MNDLTLKKIDSIASDYYSEVKIGNNEKSLMHRNKLWEILYIEYSSAFDPDVINNTFFSCIKNWNGEGSFAKYFSFAVSRRKKDSFKKKASDTVSIYSENDDEEELSILNQKQYATYDTYKTENTAEEYLSVLTDAIETINAIYKTRKTINYSRLYFTETAAALREDGNVTLSDIENISDDVMKALDNGFLDFFKVKSCINMKDVFEYSCRFLYEFTDSADKNTVCMSGTPPHLHSEVFAGFIMKNGEKSVTAGNLSQQRKKYNELRTRIMNESI